MRRIGIFAAAGIALATAAVAQGYRVGDRVEAYSPMAGRWVPGRIVSLDGNRFMFRADDHNLANDYWGTTADQLRQVGAVPPPPRPMLARPGPRPLPPQPRVVPAPLGGCGGEGGGGTMRIAGAVPAPLGGGIFPNGRPLGTPGQTNYMNNKNGQKSIVAVAPPGLGSVLGRYSLMVGGTWSTAGTRDLGGGVTQRTLEWNVPAQANVLVINADHSWYRKSGSHRYSGRWIDLGQNVAQFIGYDGDDWTGSIQRWNDGTCRMEMRGPLGQNEWGKRI
jgi:hypothetical protein